MELAHLAERMDRDDEANRHYRAAAEQAAPDAGPAVFQQRHDAE